MAVPIIYRKSSDNIISSYDYADAAAALGYSTYYALDCSGSRMVKDAIPSQVPRTTFTAAASNNTLSFTRTWSLDFNSPLTIAKATMIVSTPVECTYNGAGADSAYLTASLIKTSGGVSTTMASMSGAVASWGKAGSYVLTAQVPITQDIPIAIGDSISVKTDIYTNNAGGSVETYYIWHDAAARGSTVYNQIDPSSTAADLGYKSETTIRMIIPYKIDI